MNSKVKMVLRIVFALALLFFGGNHVFHFFDPPTPPEGAQGYWAILTDIKVILVVGIVEIISAIALIFDRFAALMMLILMSISVNAMLYHISLEPGAIGMGLFLFVMNILLLIAYKDKYQALLS
jgi:putative oxidoreductase